MNSVSSVSVGTSSQKASALSRSSIRLIGPRLTNEAYAAL
jgi:hypothetical protein